jgi:hypothetical protein
LAEPAGRRDPAHGSAGGEAEVSGVSAQPLVLVGALLAAAAAPAQTLDEIVARHAAARGGREALAAVRTLRMTGRAIAGPGREAVVRREIARPGRIRTEFVFQGTTGVYVWDGSSGWRVSPLDRGLEPEPLSEEAAAFSAEQADFEGPLVDWKAKGHQVELVGKETVDGTPTWKLKLTPKGGDVQYVFLDASSFLEIRNETHRLVRGQEMDILSTFSEFKQSGGVVWPHRIQAGPKGRSEKQVLSFDKIEVNVPIDDARFKTPSR